MRPLLRDRKQGEPKLKAEKTDHVGGYSKGVSGYDKLITRNSNRAMKKGARQESKINIKKYLEMSNE
jgi:hypothetical protein